MKMKSIFMFLLLFSILLMANASVQAYYPDSPILYDSHEDGEDDDEDDGDDDDDDDSDGDGIDDDIEEAFERELEVEESAREWHIKSELKNGENKDKIELEFKIGGGDEPEIELEYSTENDDLETEMEYRVNFDEIIEFMESGDALGYDENDTEVSVYELDKADWNDLSYAQEVVNGATVYVTTASTVDGVFMLVLKISTAIVNLTGGIVTPNSIKIDVIIDGYAYQGTGTYLALQTDIKTEFETEYEEDSEDELEGFAEDETQVGIDSTEASAFFSWVNTAVADNTTIDVLSSAVFEADEEEKDDDLDENETHQVIFFTFNAVTPDKIVWDPKVGVISVAAADYLAQLQNVASANGFNLPGFSLFLAIMSFVGLAVSSRFLGAKKELQ